MDMCGNCSKVLYIKSRELLSGSLPFVVAVTGVESHSFGSFDSRNEESRARFSLPPLIMLDAMPDIRHMISLESKLYIKNYVHKPTEE
jgi:hypothetical protein